MLDRNGLQKSLLALENLLQCLDEYRELNVRLVKAQKRLAKASRELAVGLPCTPNEKPDAIGAVRLSIASPKMHRTSGRTGKALMASSGLFESLSEVDSRFAKAITKEYDTVRKALPLRVIERLTIAQINSLGGKSFKRIAAEEREHEEQLDALNGKILKANVAYEKHVRTLASAAGGQGARRGRLSLDAHEATAAHEKHIQSVAGPTRERSIAKANHAALMAIRRDNVARETALTMTACVPPSILSSVQKR